MNVAYIILVIFSNMKLPNHAKPVTRDHRGTFISNHSSQGNMTHLGLRPSESYIEKCIETCVSNTRQGRERQLCIDACYSF